MTDHDTPRPLDELVEAGTTLMVAVTSGDGPMESRPLTVAAAHPDSVRILVDTTAQWARDLRSGDAVHVTASDNRSNVWLSLNGAVAVSTDRYEIDELWSPAADAYFDDGRGSAGIAVLRIAFSNGTYWSSPSGRVGTLMSMIKAKFGDADNSGEHGSVQLAR